MSDGLKYSMHSIVLQKGHVRTTLKISMHATQMHFFGYSGVFLFFFLVSIFNITWILNITLHHPFTGELLLTGSLNTSCLKSNESF